MESRTGVRDKSKAFFFEKKKQKTFGGAVAESSGRRARLWYVHAKRKECAVPNTTRIIAAILTAAKCNNVPGLDAATYASEYNLMLRTLQSAHGEDQAVSKSRPTRT